MKIVAYGEIMMRLTPYDYVGLSDSISFNACYGGTESNVLVALSHLGDETSFVTKIPNNGLGEGVIRHLLRHSVGVNDIVKEGTTLGIYFLEQGYGTKPSKVIYHRKDAVVNTLLEADLDYEKIFKNANWFHVTGISLAISKNSYNVSLRLCKEAKKRNIKVSFDFNYRSTLWSIEEAKKAYKEILKYVDVCFGTVFDINNFVDISCENDNDTIKKFLEEYNIDYLLNTTRKIIDANTQELKGNLFTVINNKTVHYETNSEQFEVLDRIGGGDAFCAGVIHVLNKDYKNIVDALKLGQKCGILKHLVRGDVLSLSKNEIDEWINNNKDVIR